MQNHRVEELLGKLQQFPVITAVALELVASLGRSNVDAATLGSIISRDQGLAAKVLRIANSPFYGLPRQVASIQEAVIVLGLGTVRSLALSASVAAAPSSQTGRMDRAEFWRHGIEVAIYMRALAGWFKFPQDVAFTAGLFHAIGELVLDSCLPREFGAAAELAKSTGKTLAEAEREIMDIDHAEVGAELAKRWNFPEAIENTIRLADALPEQSWTTTCPEAVLVQLAHGCLAAGDGNACMHEELEQACRQFGVDWQTLRQRLPDRARMEAEIGGMLHG